jgi:hypothetical protein
MLQDELDAKNFIQITADPKELTSCDNANTVSGISSSIGTLHFNPETFALGYFDGNAYVSVSNSVKVNKISISLTENFKWCNIMEECLFCHNVHCQHELMLRPLYKELAAFLTYENFSRNAAIDFGRIEISATDRIAKYYIKDILISSYTFDGITTFYFEPINHPQEWKSAEQRISEIQEVIGKIFSLKISIDDQEMHGINITWGAFDE